MMNTKEMTDEKLEEIYQTLHVILCDEMDDDILSIKENLMKDIVNITMEQKSRAEYLH